jgi:hypothetical protein
MRRCGCNDVVCFFGNEKESHVPNPQLERVFMGKASGKSASMSSGNAEPGANSTSARPKHRSRHARRGCNTNCRVDRRVGGLSIYYGGDGHFPTGMLYWASGVSRNGYDAYTEPVPMRHVDRLLVGETFCNHGGCVSRSSLSARLPPLHPTNKTRHRRNVLRPNRPNRWYPDTVLRDHEVLRHRQRRAGSGA